MANIKKKENDLIGSILFDGNNFTHPQFSYKG